jgi:hypothetical protein
MFPLIAIGAAIAGGIAAYAASSSDSPRAGSPARADSDVQAPAPQSYLVTPVSSGNVAVEQSQAMRNSISRLIV